jgi:hypothetical protein
VGKVAPFLAEAQDVFLPLFPCGADILPLPLLRGLSS